MKRFFTVMVALALLLPMQAAKKAKQQPTDREYWCALA